MMRFLLKLVLKFVFMVAMVLLLGSGLRYGQRFIIQNGAGGVPGVGGVGDVKFSSEEADLMATVFKSALRLFSGTANRKELAGELSDKLYAGRADAGTMSELGIELVKPGEDPAKPANSSATGEKGQPLANASTGTTAKAAGANPAKTGAKTGE